MNFFKNPIENAKKKDEMAPSYIKSDGTKVIEKQEDYGSSVYEISPDGTVIMRGYDPRENLICDYARQRNLEIGHRYDSFGKVLTEFNNLYDEHNVLAKKYEKEYEYYDNGVKSKEITDVFPGDIRTILTFDEKGKRLEKIEQRGAVKTWFDENDVPIKREIDRGSGGIITQDLRKK